MDEHVHLCALTGTGRKETDLSPMSALILKTQLATEHKTHYDAPRDKLTRRDAPRDKLTFNRKDKLHDNRVDMENMSGNWLHI